MTRLQPAEDSSSPSDRERAVCQGSLSGGVVLRIDFRSRLPERIYDADKIWSGEHTLLDYTEI